MPSLGETAPSQAARYLLKGATFVGFQNLLLGHAAPSASAMQAEAQKALARVP
jgi:hypothetical protein